MDQRLLDGLSLDGTLYLLPNTWNTMLIYYNTTMFADAGIDRPSDDWTWDDFLAVAQQLTTGDGDAKVFGFVRAVLQLRADPLVLQQRHLPAQCRLDSQSNLTDPKMAESVTWIRDLVTDARRRAPAPRAPTPTSCSPPARPP